MEPKSKTKLSTSIGKELNDLAEQKIRFSETVLSFTNKKLDFEREMNEDLLLMDKISLLRHVMVSEYGDTKFSMGESFSSKPLFSEDDMIPLKGKLFELVKKL